MLYTQDQFLRNIHLLCSSKLKMEKVVFLLWLVVALCCAAKQRRQPTELDYKAEAEKVNLKGCTNLTTVLDNWKFAIITQFKNLLQYDHQTVLPDYGRIKSLSEALDDLYKEFNFLKERLGELTTKFDNVEGFVDEMKASRYQRQSERTDVPDSERVISLPAAPGKRRVLVRKNKKTAETYTTVESP